MKFVPFVALASMALAAPSSEKRDDSPLDIKIEMVGNSEVKATIVNTGSSSLKVLKTGSILDSAPVEKARVFKDSNALEFEGARLLIDTEHLNDEAFQKIAAGETIEVTFDVAEVHDLSAGGDFDISVVGGLSYAEEGSNKLSGAVPFVTSSVTAQVDGPKANAVRIASQSKRTAVQSDCTGTRLTAVRNALSNCRSLASAASTAASSGAAAKMTEFFKSSTSATRSTVAGVFSRTASECGSTTSGNSRTYCSDPYPACSNGVIAYTVPASSYMAYCNYFFTMPATSSGCYTQTQANTFVHEVTHLSQIKGTSDYGGYGYNFVRGLTAAQNLNHADTYTLFAQSLYAGC
ncbi:unnamed protein product [Clonostachys byssicola]|uniref:Neutral protease 2 n=1 Tax=Clonostachys byssicola TaxID=160290 RepID=A0A9N9U480_9HYPO|nr:unnamed protein product [Clonostachys byssicola]